MNNIGEAKWKDGKYYTVRYAIPLDFYNDELVFIVFMDGDFAILHKEEIHCPILKNIDEFIYQGCYVSNKAKKIMQNQNVNSMKENENISKNLFTQKEGNIVLTNMTLDNIADIITNALSSKEIDPTGKETSKPLFDRNEKEISKQLCTFLSSNPFPSLKYAIPEKKYQNSRKQCDIVLNDKLNNELWIELKQSWEKKCTDWETAFTERKYFADIEKLKEIPKSSKGIFLHIAYRPIDAFPNDWPITSFIKKLKDTPFIWKKFNMPTEDHGPCTCHILLWLVN